MFLLNGLTTKNEIWFNFIRNGKESRLSMSQQPNGNYGRRSSDWYIPVGLVVASVTTIAGVYSIVSPIVNTIIEINIKLTRLETSDTRISNLEKEIEELRKDLYERKSSK